MRLGEGKKFVETDWKRRWAYQIFGEPHVPGWIRLRHAIRAIERLPLSGPIRVLDAGCGRGDLSTYLAERHPDWTFVGIEIEPDRIEKAETIREHMRLDSVRYQVGDLCELPFDNEFDLVVCLDVMEHIANDKDAIRSFCRALKPGGYVIVSSPSVPQPIHLRTVRWREKRIGFTPEEYGHVRDGYSLEELKTLYAEQGIETVELRYTYGPWGTMAFDLFFSIGDSRPNPLVFAGMYPLLKGLARMDLHDHPSNGAAVMATGKKKDILGARQ